MKAFAKKAATAVGAVDHSQCDCVHAVGTATAPHPSACAEHSAHGASDVVRPVLDPGLGGTDRDTGPVWARRSRRRRTCSLRWPNLQNMDQGHLRHGGAVGALRIPARSVRGGLGTSWVGWLAPQIDIFYHLGERIVGGAIFNTTEWLTGQGSFIDTLVSSGLTRSTRSSSLRQRPNWFLAAAAPPIHQLPVGRTRSQFKRSRSGYLRQLTWPAPYSVAGGLDTSRLTAARVVDAQVTNTPSPAIEFSNPLRKVDPFNITTTAQGTRKPLRAP